MKDKQIIIDGVDVSRCEYLDNIDFDELCLMLSSPYECQVNCSNKPNCYYKQFKRSEAQCEGMFVSHTDLEKKYKAKEQECEEFRKTNDEKNKLLAKLGCPTTATAKRKVFCLQEQLDQLKTELKSAKELREYTYNCCKQAGEELAKNSFEWDGKEKNLVVQAMELNERYDKLKTENDSLKRQLQFEFDETLLQYSNIIEDLQKQLKDSVMQKCPQCGEVYLNPIGCELYDENKELKEQFKLAEPLYQACNIKDEKINKLRQTLLKIKEIAEKSYKTPLAEKDCIICDDFLGQILQKISECEVENE